VYISTKIFTNTSQTHVDISRLTNAPTPVSSSAKDHENENGILYNKKSKDFYHYNNNNA